MFDLGKVEKSNMKIEVDAVVGDLSSSQDVTLTIDNNKLPSPKYFYIKQKTNNRKSTSIRMNVINKPLALSKRSPKVPTREDLAMAE